MNQKAQVLIKFGFYAVISICNINLLFSQKIAENYIVFEAENTTSNLGEWKLITSLDSGYFNPEGGMPPINGTYLEFTGNTVGGGQASSPLVYTFVCPKTGVYQCAMRMHQRLMGNKDDKCNDVYVKLEGNYTSGNDQFTLEHLQNNTKFYGRGIATWGTAHSGEGGVNHKIGKMLYKLIQGEEYRFTMSGRSKNTQIDYILFFETSLAIIAASHKDLASSNEPKYLP